MKTPDFTTISFALRDVFRDCPPEGTEDDVTVAMRFGTTDHLAFDTLLDGADRLHANGPGQPRISVVVSNYCERIHYVTLVWQADTAGAAPRIRYVEVADDHHLEAMYEVDALAPAAPRIAP